MSGPDVKEWQEFLIFLAGPTVVGPTGADGIFGAMTQAATAAFQRSSNLVDDGVAGPLTYRAALAAGY
jgi:peptidoglycan hydrolase-like protein with peptidoglycan-binding domain